MEELAVVDDGSEGGGGGGGARCRIDGDGARYQETAPAAAPRRRRRLRAASSRAPRAPKSGAPTKTFGPRPSPLPPQVGLPSGGSAALASTEQLSAGSTRGETGTFLLRSASADNPADAGAH